MGLIGKTIRENLPTLYYAGINIKNRLKRGFQSKEPYITDSLGGSFKAYLNSKKNDEVIKTLKNGLDQDSKDTIDVIVDRLIGYPDENDRRNGKPHGEVIGGLLPVENASFKQEVENYMKRVKSMYTISPPQYDESVFYFHHGLRILPTSVLEYIKGSAFIDCGAYIGDSAIALKEYEYDKIYSLEISKKSIGRYKLNLERNQIPENKYQIIEVGISPRDDLGATILPDTGSAGFSLFRSNSQYDHIKVEQKSLDYIVDHYGITPKLIKADIEGAAYDLVSGGIETFRKHRPVFSIAIYHNPKEFFEVKPFLESILHDYTFIIRKFESDVHKNHCHSEVVMLGYPNEILSE